jgi:hypothetical protein
MRPHHVASIHKAQVAIESFDPGRAAGRLHSLERRGKERIEFHRMMSGMVKIDTWLVDCFMHSTRVPSVPQENRGK